MVEFLENIKLVMDALINDWIPAVIEMYNSVISIPVDIIKQIIGFFI